MDIVFCTENKSERKALFQSILRKPFCKTDKDLLGYIYDCPVPAVLESTNKLRARVSQNDVKYYLDSKNPAPAATGDGIQKG